MKLAPNLHNRRAEIGAGFWELVYAAMVLVCGTFVVDLCVSDLV